MTFTNDWNFWISLSAALIGIALGIASIVQASGAKKAASETKVLLQSRNAEVEISRMITQLQGIKYSISFEEADRIISEASIVGLDQYGRSASSSNDYSAIKSELDTNLQHLRNNLQQLLPLPEVIQDGLVFKAINESRHALISTLAKIKSDLRSV